LSFNIFSDVWPHFVFVQPYSPSDRVFMKSPPNREDFTLVYKYFFKELDIFFPFPDFKCGMLTSINVASYQLHPNNWAFFKAFQVLCGHLLIKSSVNASLFLPIEAWCRGWLGLFKRA